MAKEYEVSGTTYEFPDDFSDEKVQQILTQQGIIKSTQGGFGHNLLEGAKGFAKGLGRDLLENATGPIAKITPLGPVGEFLTDTGLADKFRQATEPTNTAQKVGNAAETVGTFLLPGGEEAEGVAGIARAGTRQGVKLARRLTGRASAADTAGLASGIGSALEHPAADLAAHTIPGGPLLLRVARKLGIGGDKLMSKDELAVELFKRNNGGSAPKTIAEQARARVDIDRFIKNIREGYEPKTGPKPPALKPENINTGRSVRGKPFEIKGRAETPEPEPRSVNKGHFQIPGRPEPKLEEGPDLTRSQPSKLNVYEPKRPRTTAEKIKAGRAKGTPEPQTTSQAGYKSSPHSGSTSRELDPGKVINAQAEAKNIAMAKRFKSLNMTPEEVEAMTETEFNAHRLEENVERKAQGLPQMERPRPGVNRRSFDELKADIARTMRSQ